MIKYTLLCEFQHSFEGWFSDSTSFEKQCKLNLVSCPECGNSAIKRALMTPNLSVSSHKKKNAEHSDISTSRTEDNKSQPSGKADKVLSETSNQTIPLINPDQVMTMLRQIRNHVEKNGRNVGDKFADEALKIHYGDKEQETIYGTCTPEEGEKLAEEGVQFAELPEFPKDN